MSENKYRDPGHPDLLGALVMGLLDPAEAAGVQSHVAQCGPCHSELAAMMALRGRLDAVPAHDVLAEYARQESFGTASPTDDIVLRRVLGAMRGVPVQKPLNRAWRTAAAVIVFAAVGGIGAVIGRATAPEPGPAISSTAGAQVFETKEPSTGIGAWIEVIPVRPSWVRLRIRLAAPPPGQTCEVYAVSSDGRRKLAASWVAHRPDEVAPVVEGTAAFAAQDIIRFEVTDPAGKLWVTVPT
jgi:hypothetical protein